MGYGIHQHKLYHPEGVEYIPSPDHGGEITPEAIILHYTAGSSAKSDVRWLTMRDEIYVSAHLVIGRAGEVTQLIPFNQRAYHAGRSSWEGRQELNGWSIGIEFANWGKLRRVDNECLSWSGTLITKERIAQVADTYWETFYTTQLEIGKVICSLLLKTYPIKYILGHYEVAPGRKIDPGGAFPLEAFRPDVLRKKTDTLTEEDRILDLERRVALLEGRILINDDE